jgi:hypothetical protein
MILFDFINLTGKRLEEASLKKNEKKKFEHCKKKLRLRPNILSKILGGRSLNRLM